MCRIGRSHRQRHARPGQNNHRHHRRGDHDLQRLAARFMNAQQILPQKINRRQAGHRHRSPLLDAVGPRRTDEARAEHSIQRFDNQPHDVLPGRHAADRPGQHVIEQQRRHRELRQKAPHRFLHHLVHAAAHEQRTAFDVHAPHAVTEQQHAQNEPRRRLADGAFDNRADVVRRARHVAQHDGGRPPIRNEREHHAADDHHLRSATQLAARPGATRIQRR